jgi:RNA ligase partner protein
MAPAKPEAERLVLDTSVFVNPDVRAALGPTPTEALRVFASLASKAGSLEFYMPSSVFEELMNFVSRDELPDEVFLYLKQKSPRKHELTTPAFLLYELMEEMRDRVNKGLRLAEKAARGAASAGSSHEQIKELRRKYRDALREGIIDSKEDVDLILLGMELQATLVTADQGAIKWADKLGVKWLLPGRFRAYLDAALSESAGGGK